MTRIDTISRPSFRFLLALAVLASGSGLLLAIHLHEEGHAHHPQACQVCQTLAVFGATVPEQAPGLSPDAGQEAPVALIRSSRPAGERFHSPIGSRAPPAAI